MPRVPRLVVSDPGQKSIYHVISRTALDGLPFKKVEKDELVQVIMRFSAIYFVTIFGYAIMGNHFHLLVEVSPVALLSDEEVRDRFRLLYGDDLEFPEGRLDEYRERFCNLSAYVKDIKQTFSRFYNKRKKRKGTLWGERFKSVIVERGNTVINCLAYIDLNRKQGTGSLFWPYPSQPLQRYYPRGPTQTTPLEPDPPDPGVCPHRLPAPVPPERRTRTHLRGTADDKVRGLPPAGRG